MISGIYTLRSELAMILTGFLLALSIFRLTMLEREEFGQLMVWYSLAFLCYWVIYKGTVDSWSLKPWLILAILCRLLTFWGMPNLSDDFYRFIWDGQLVLAGLNPYMFTPAELMASGLPVTVDTALFAELNSPAYHSVYPPFAQCIFAISAWLGSGEPGGIVFIQRIILLLFETGTIWLFFVLIRKLALPGKTVLLYALNPLVIIELTGNLHYEGIVLFFLLTGIHFGMKGNGALSGLGVSAAILTKLTPAIAIPFFLKKSMPGKFSMFLLPILVLTSCFLLTVVAWPGSSGFFSSLSLYFGTFEFNAGIYNLINAITSALAGFNTIGYIAPILAGLTLIALGALFFWARKRPFHELPTHLLLAFSVFLLFASTVHPWYIIPILGLALLSKLKYPILWSYLIFLSYSAYSSEPYRENDWLIGVEYLLLAGWAVFELKRHKVFTRRGG